MFHNLCHSSQDEARKYTSNRWAGHHYCVLLCALPLPSMPAFIVPSSHMIDSSPLKTCICCALQPHDRDSVSADGAGGGAVGPPAGWGPQDAAGHRLWQRPVRGAVDGAGESHPRADFMPHRNDACSTLILKLDHLRILSRTPHFSSSGPDVGWVRYLPCHA